MRSPFLHFYLGRSHLPENSILFVNRPFAAQFSSFSNSLNFEAKINFKTTRQNDLKWRKTCTGLKFDLKHFNDPQIKFIGDSLYKHPVLYILYYYYYYKFCAQYLCLFYFFTAQLGPKSWKVESRINTDIFIYTGAHLDNGANWLQNFSCTYSLSIILHMTDNYLSPAKARC